MRGSELSRKKSTATEKMSTATQASWAAEAAATMRHGSTSSPLVRLVAIVIWQLFQPPCQILFALHCGRLIDRPITGWLIFVWACRNAAGS